MQLTESVTPEDLLAQVTRLEDQVAKLSAQLASNQETIGLLKHTLAERDSKIHELEANLIVTPTFLIQNIQTKLQHYQLQIKDGIDSKLMQPALGQIHQQMALVERILTETRRFIEQSKQIIYRHIDSTLAVINHSPEQARDYFEKSIVEPLLSLVHQIVEKIKTEVGSTQLSIQQLLISPSKSFYQQSLDAVLALPAQSQILFQIWIVEPIIRNIDDLSDNSRQLSSSALAAVKNLCLQLKQLLDKGFEFLADQVKQSPFWDGKHNKTAMA